MVVLYNALCHSRIEEILWKEEFKDHKFLRLALYSPIKHDCFVVKADVKRIIVENMPDMLNDELRGY